jgi:hypothetical protein
MRRILALVFALSLAASIPLSAQGKGKGKGKASGNDKAHDTNVIVVFNDNQRSSVRTYFADTYGRGNCPPGLAKKNNGCLPPGQAKKRYAVGQRLPGGIVIADLPDVLSRRIGPAPDGYRYGLVDGDLVKLALGTMLVVDAIDAFVR